MNVTGSGSHHSQRFENGSKRSLTSSFLPPVDACPLAVVLASEGSEVTGLCSE